ncbi:SCO family protein [Mucilaginibacter sp. X5P1]|uniref:SCO family protein n=1 Tax=Mucilaginibacter sp. X5P1 TaxID=2723088 RepID=UPI00161ECE53|nr:SCO family protein [Mucilaginibacter sp. X5P1]MBB6137434.1 protein SCO1/2 [Mucilaginibacter sp. X5P1]
MRKLTGVIVLVLLFGACKTNTTKNTLPIYGQRTAVTKTVNGQQVTDTDYQTIPAFKFVNQYGDSTGSKDLEGKIYVADFFFTSCPSICPIMQRNMLNVYNEFKNTPDFKIISFTIDPKHDTVPVLKNYADKLGISGNSWWLMLGARDSVYNLAAKSYLVAVSEDSTVAGGYMHQGYFVLIDKQKRVRGSYDGTDMKQVNQLIDDIKTLQAEPAPTAQ